MPVCQCLRVITRKRKLEHRGARVVSVQTVDTNVIIIIAAMFHQLQSGGDLGGVRCWQTFSVSAHIRFAKILEYLDARHRPSTMHSPVVIPLHNSMVKKRSLHGRLGNLTLVPHKHSIILKHPFHSFSNT